MSAGSQELDVKYQCSSWPKIRRCFGACVSTPLPLPCAPLCTECAVPYPRMLHPSTFPCTQLSDAEANPVTSTLPLVAPGHAGKSCSPVNVSSYQHCMLHVCLLLSSASRNFTLLSYIWFLRPNIPYSGSVDAGSDRCWNFVCNFTSMCTRP
jgi:hypothetical protein